MKKPGSFTLVFALVALVVSIISTIVNFHLVREFRERMQEQESSLIPPESLGEIRGSREFMAKNTSVIRTDQGTLMIFNKACFANEKNEKYDDFRIIIFSRAKGSWYFVRPHENNDEFVSFLVPTDSETDYFNIEVRNKTGWNFFRS